MIPQPLGYAVIMFDLLQRLDVAQKDVSAIAGILADPAQVVNNANDARASGSYSVQGWRDHFAAEQARFTALRPTLTKNHEAAFPGMTAALDDYLAGLPNVLAALDVVLTRYPTSDLKTVGPRAVDGSSRGDLAAALTAQVAPAAVVG
jgi:hypothetical protein